MIAIDLSLRSTGIVSLSDELELEGFKIVSTPLLNDEDLIIYNTNAIVDFVEQFYHEDICIEGLSFNSVSSSKDILAGNYWYLRTKLYKYGKIHIIPVQRWRCALFDKDTRKWWKDNGHKSKYLKDMVVAGLPADVEMKFGSYVESSEWLKKEAIYDLADAYHIGKYQILHGEK